MLISVALMNTQSFCKQSTTHYHPLTEEEKMDDNPPLFPSSPDYFYGGTNTNNQSQLTGKVGFHGTPLLAQLHQERLKLWFFFNTTVTRFKSTEGSVTVADAITVPLSLDLTVDCVFSCLYMTERPETLERPDSAL